MEGTNSIDLLRVSTAGSVDDGKSTLIGRLLLDSDNLYEDHVKKITSTDGPSSALALADVTDGLRAEREQGITIDVAYRYFSTPSRRIILADTPGHEQYTRNMATGASTADMCILLLDATKGVLTQTKRHAFIASLLGVPRLLVAINKMDLEEYREEVFQSIKTEFIEFAKRLVIKDINFIPISALQGDNVVKKHDSMPWYEGPSVMRYLETVYIGSDRNTIDFRFPVQCVSKFPDGSRGYLGQIASGSISVGEEVTILPSMRSTTIRELWVSSEKCVEKAEHAEAAQSIGIVLADEIDVSRGSMIVRQHNIPSLQDQVEAILIWMNEEPLDLSKRYLLQHNTQTTHAYVDSLQYGIDINTLKRKNVDSLYLNEVGRVKLSTTEVIPYDSYQSNRHTGHCILIDPDTFQTVGAAMLIRRMPEDLLIESKAEQEKASVAPSNIHKEKGKVLRTAREASFGHRATTLWFTGLSGSGKSTLAIAAESALFSDGIPVYRLDGDNLRSGLNKDLGFSKYDRKENIRRVAEVARLFNDAGISVICAFISPYMIDREAARDIVGHNAFIEIHVSTPLEECEKRDPHGLYQKARDGEIHEFTGVSAPYEVPKNPDLRIDTSQNSLEQCLETILAEYKRTVS